MRRSYAASRPAVAAARDSDTDDEFDFIKAMEVEEAENAGPKRASPSKAGGKKRKAPTPAGGGGSDDESDKDTGTASGVTLVLAKLNLGAQVLHYTLARSA